MEGRIIEMVRQYPALYDTNSQHYKDRHIRAEAWEKIGRELNIKGEKVKFLWNKLRRCFINAINRRRFKKSTGTKKVTLWRFEHQMSFLVPHLDHRNKLGETYQTTDSQLQECIWMDEDTTLNEAIEKAEIEINENTESVEITSQYSDSQESEEHFNQNVDTMNGRKKNEENYLEKSSTDVVNDLNKLDDSDLFYLSLSRIAKRLPEVEQARIKLKISTIVMEAEIKNAEIRFPIENRKDPLFTTRVSSS